MNIDNGKEYVLFEKYPPGTKFFIKAVKDEYRQRRVICYYEATYYGLDRLEIYSKTRKYRIKWHPLCGYRAYRIFGKLPNENANQICKWYYTDEYYPHYTGKYYLQFSFLDVKLIQYPEVEQNIELAQSPDNCYNENFCNGNFCNYSNSKEKNYYDLVNDVDETSFEVSNLYNLFQYEPPPEPVIMNYDFPEIEYSLINSKKKRKTDNIYESKEYKKKRLMKNELKK